VLIRIHERLNRENKGFTLIELMVVVLIIAILIAIAIPTFLGARTKAQDRASQADLRQSLLTAKAYYTDQETFGTVGNDAANAAAYQALEPSLTFDAVANASLTKIGVLVTGVGGVEITLSRKSKSGQWACIGESTGTASAKFITTDKPAANPYTTFASCQPGTAVGVAW
jgi:type IV pilus assembly protein PilA